jgi:hypothetical protein
MHSNALARRSAPRAAAARGQPPRHHARCKCAWGAIIARTRLPPSSLECRLNLKIGPGVRIIRAAVSARQPGVPPSNGPRGRALCSHHIKLLSSRPCLLLRLRGPGQAGASQCARLVAYSASAPQCAVAGWPCLPRPAKSNGMAKMQSPAAQLGVGEARGKPDRGDGRGITRAECTGWECRGRSQHACDVRRVRGDVQPAARGSVRYCAALSMPWQRSCLDGPLVCPRRRLSGCTRALFLPCRQ